MARNGTNRLHGIAQFSLFATSYLPLFILLIGKQINNNYEYLNYSGFDKESLMIFITKFGLSFILTLIALLGYLGFSLTIKNLENDADNGFAANIGTKHSSQNHRLYQLAKEVIILT